MILVVVGTGHSRLLRGGGMTLRLHSRPARIVKHGCSAKVARESQKSEVKMQKWSRILLQHFDLCLLTYLDLAQSQALR
jgi:hypothetical protein